MTRTRVACLGLIALLAATPATADPLQLGAAQREQLGLASEAVAAGRDDGAVEATGRVLDPGDLVEAAVARDAARSAAALTARELARVGHLSRGQENASQRDLEVAEDADARAKLDLQAAEARLVATWGEQISERSDLGALVDRVARRRAALARVDLPADLDVRGAPASVQVATAAQPARSQVARVLGPAPSVDPTVQGSGWLVSLEDAPPPAGAALVATLVFPERTFDGVVIPRSALVRRGGDTFVFVEVGPGGFERRAVELRRARADGWLARGVAPGERVVVRGAEALLAAELSPAASEPD